MDGLIELIFKNPFLLILILGGIFSMFGGKKTKNQEEQEDKRKEQRQQQARQQRQAPAPSRNVPPPFNPQPKPERKTYGDKTEEQITDTLSIDDQREEQIKRLTEQYRTNEHSGLTDKAEVAHKRREIEVQNIKSKYSKQFKQDFKKSLTHKGLINSIVMAEVLGRPRASRPYESVIMKRRIK